MKQISLTEGKKRETLRDLPKEVTQNLDFLKAVLTYNSLHIMYSY